MLSDQRIMNPLNAYRCSVAYITSRRKEEVVEQRMAKGSWNDAAFSLPCYQIDVSRAGQNQLLCTLPPFILASVWIPPILGGYSLEFLRGVPVSLVKRHRTLCSEAYPLDNGKGYSKPCASWLEKNSALQYLKILASSNKIVARSS